ncbi:MAG: dephospho-CoA kinase [Flavobacteriales bacterium]|nr:dephospho-CoA kinase [Flavobacteriales bacterium]MCW8911951.1 dephospho-CoA kinase [Flavobacteriales bacterium]MCW8937101.1 dephospho-CoA kinase [Flavobacteriales bacterium]MCW8941071.1 dephospho-CoA kinase [Flavobacteriales bacterium]MCW8968830.1 dephospho-CoA kinase [Flavobacteriales bacterium]
MNKSVTKPIIIGLTGGIGSGKSTIAEIFTTLKIPVFNSDQEAKKLYSLPEVKQQIIKHFGNVYTEQNQLDKKALGSIVFNNDEKLQLLNSIIHPAVKTLFENWVTKNNQASILIKEAAILIESGAAKQVDKIIVVTAPKKERVKRVMQRDNVSEKEVIARMSKQLPEEELIAQADFIIKNDNQHLVIPQVLDIIKKL